MSNLSPYYQLQYLYNLQGKDMSEIDWLNSASAKLREQGGFPLTSSALADLLILHHRAPLSLSDFEQYVQQNQTAVALESSQQILVTAYRGEHGKPEEGTLFQSRLASLSFGSQSAARQYALSPNMKDDIVDTPRIIKATLVINNPVMNDPDDPFLELGPLLNSLGREKVLTLAQEQIAHLSNTDNWHEMLETHGLNNRSPEEALAQLSQLPDDEGLGQLYLDAYPVFDNPKYINWFKAAGYDGVVQGGNGETALEPEYKIFSADQAKILSIEPATPKSPRVAPRI